MSRLSRVVLVADHNSINRYIACRMLRQGNYSTIEARWGREAVELARQVRPDIIVLDVQLPDQSGFLTLEQLHADPRTVLIPVVFLTASGQSAFARNQTEQHCASAYLFSATQADTLVKVVEGSLEKATPLRSSQGSDYENIVDNAVAVMRSDYASLQMLFPERGSGGELLLLGFRGFNPQAAKFWKWVRADSNSTCGIALRESERVVAPDIAGCDFMAGSEDQQVYLQTGIRACQTTPLIGRGGNVVGMISTHWRTPHKPSETDFRSFNTLARHAADVIESSLAGR